jgi:hypothetical protein
MTIEDSFKTAINNAFVNTIFVNRNSELILNILSTKVYGSNNISIVPPIPYLEVNKLDDTHDKVWIKFDDYSFEGIIHWKPCANKQNYVFIRIE